VFLARPPGPALRPHVSLLWVARGATSSARREWVFPSATAQLLVNVVTDRLTFHRSPREPRALAGAAVSGPFSRPLLVEAREQEHVCGASFHPGGLAAFVDVPGHALHDEMVDLAELAPGHDRAALDRVRDARDPDAQLTALEAFLGTLRCPRRPPALVSWAVGRLEDPTRRIQDLVADSGWSRRRFVRSFERAVGVTPKRFQRVRRLRRALGEMGGDACLGQVAHAAGFYDQAHLVHEFQELAGMSPTAYLARRTGYVGHVVAE